MLLILETDWPSEPCIIWVLLDVQWLKCPIVDHSLAEQMLSETVPNICLAHEHSLSFWSSIKSTVSSLMDFFNFFFWQKWSYHWRKYLVNIETTTTAFHVYTLENKNKIKAAFCNETCLSWISKDFHDLAAVLWNSHWELHESNNKIKATIVQRTNLPGLEERHCSENTKHWNLTHRSTCVQMSPWLHQRPDFPEDSASLKEIL